MLKPICCLSCCGALACTAFLATTNPSQDARCAAESSPTDTESFVAISEQTAINDICPISGDAVDADAPTVEYHGFTIAVSSHRAGEVFLKVLSRPSGNEQQNELGGGAGRKSEWGNDG